MKHFSEKFLVGLRTKSQRFQDYFASTMEEIDSFFDEEDEIKEFHEYIESQISYDKPGNLLYSAKMVLGGEDAEDGTLGHEINRWFFEQFEEDADAFSDATHFIIGIRCEEGVYTELDEMILRSVMSLRRAGDEPAVVMIRNDQKDGVYANCFMAVMK